jgi:hypothetical protein
MIRRAPSDLGGYPIEAEFAQMEFIHKNVNHPNRIILVDPILQAFRKKCALPAIRTLNEALHPILAAPESLTRESHKAAFSHSQGHDLPSGSVDAMAARPSIAALEADMVIGRKGP